MCLKANFHKHTEHNQMLIVIAPFVRNVSSNCTAFEALNILESLISSQWFNRICLRYSIAYDKASSANTQENKILGRVAQSPIKLTQG